MKGRGLKGKVEETARAEGRGQSQRGHKDREAIGGLSRDAARAKPKRRRGQRDGLDEDAARVEPKRWQGQRDRSDGDTRAGSMRLGREWGRRLEMVDISSLGFFFLTRL